MQLTDLLTDFFTAESAGTPTIDQKAKDALGLDLVQFSSFNLEANWAYSGGKNMFSFRAHVQLVSPLPAAAEIVLG